MTTLPPFFTALQAVAERIEMRPYSERDADLYFALGFEAGVTSCPALRDAQKARGYRGVRLEAPALADECAAAWVAGYDAGVRVVSVR